MTAPPPPAFLPGLEAPRALAADPPVLLRPATPADAAALRAFYIAGRAPDFAPLALPEAMAATLLDGQFRAQQAGYAARFPDLATSVLTSGAALVGRLMLAREGADGATALRVVDIALALGWRGRGLGGAVLALVEAGARAEGLGALALDVAIDNPGARRLYERIGFSVDMSAPAGNGVSLAMRKALT